MAFELSDKKWLLVLSDEARGPSRYTVVVAEVALDVAGDRVGVVARATSQRKPRLEMRLDRALQQRAFGPPPAIRRHAARRGRPLCPVAPWHPMKRDGRSG